MMKFGTTILFLLVFLYSFSQNPIKEIQGASDKAQEILWRSNNRPLTPSKYVNPFIGTGGHGHTFPGATTPFGMIQLSPDTREDNWDGSSGYHYSDSIIYGFSHTHLSGTGIPDYCDILFVPQIGKAKLTPGYKNKDGYGAPFKHINEIANPGFYEVKLDNGIQVRLSATKRAGIHEYTFIEKKGAKTVLIDLDHRDQVINAAFTLIDKQTISGKRISNSWAKEQHVYFHIETSIPYSKATMITKNGAHKLLLTFPNDTKKLLIKTGISAVDEQGALTNLKQEIPHWNFNEIVANTTRLWNKELSKIEISDKNETNLRIFYTALYHTFISPNIFSDQDGRYRGRDNKIHSLSKQDQQFTVFSLWDTYRAAHPLYTIVQQELTNQFIRTFLRQYEEGGDLPVWELAGNETECMIGYHSVSVISDAYLKNLSDFDTIAALKAMVNTSNFDEYGKKRYAADGFISSDQEPESVSKTLEYAYNDYCIYKMAEKMGEDEIAKTYLKRSFNFINLFDPTTSFMRAKRGAQWFSPFIPSDVNFNYTEANSWQYSMYAPQSIPQLNNMLGGKNKLETWLNQLFTTATIPSGREQADITGLIGQYAHGNEPSHHMAYLYNFTNSPHLTQFYVDSILKTMYSNQPDGLSGNEDCGQMSAWYVLSSMGFYPVTPGSSVYQIGRPIFDQVRIKMENGNVFSIKTFQNSAENKYIDYIKLNDSIITSNTLNHSDIIAGGELIFYMTNIPKIANKPAFENKEFYDVNVPENFVPVPFIINETRIFEEMIKIDCGVYRDIKNESLQIYYSLDSLEWLSYSDPILLKKSSQIWLKTIKEIGRRRYESAVVSSYFIKKDSGIHIDLKTPYSSQYAASGTNSLIDGIRGANEYRTGDWQGFYQKDISAVVSFDQARQLNEIGVSFIRDIRSWIFFPSQINIESSADGINYTTLVSQRLPALSQSDLNVLRQEFKIVAPNQDLKSIRFTIINGGNCPPWHLGSGNPSWLFLDELIVR